MVWPAQLPDFSICNYILWEYLKVKVFIHKLCLLMNSKLLFIKNECLLYVFMHIHSFLCFDTWTHYRRVHLVFFELARVGCCIQYSSKDHINSITKFTILYAAYTSPVVVGHQSKWIYAMASTPLTLQNSGIDFYGFWSNSKLIKNIFMLKISCSYKSNTARLKIKYLSSYL